MATTDKTAPDDWEKLVDDGFEFFLSLEPAISRCSVRLAISDTETEPTVRGRLVTALPDRETGITRALTRPGCVYWRRDPRSRSETVLAALDAWV